MMNEIVVTEPNRGGEGAPLFTCNTCGLTFPSADLQRIHMKTDWHRYNLKRRVASLPPISSEMFAEKMINQQHIQKLAEERTGRGSSSRSSGQRQVTKKDKKREEKLLRKATSNRTAKASKAAKDSDDVDLDKEISRPGSPEGSVASGISSTFSLGDPVGSHYAASGTEDDSDLYHEEDDSEDDLTNGHYTKGENKVPSKPNEGSDIEEDEETLIEKELSKNKAKALHIPPTTCLVDGKEFKTVEDNIAYMTKKYGLYVPEVEYLVDLEGLVTYLGEKIGLGNMCLACSFQGRNVESVRAHMISKSHVRIPYESTQEKLEISEFYDFTSSYSNVKSKPSTTAGAGAELDGEDDDWEEVDEEEEDDDFDEIPEEDYVDDSGFELALAPGLRAGHRSLQRYYRQSLRSTEVTRDGQGTVMAVDVRSAGLLTSRDPVQEKQQKRVWKELRKQQNIAYRRDKFINNQPHFRDELLQ